jgi:hypothetical protein
MHFLENSGVSYGNRQVWNSPEWQIESNSGRQVAKTHKTGTLVHEAH